MCLKSKILIIGTLPETAGIGGVTIHIKRLLDFLQKNNFNFDFVDYKNKSILSLIKEIISHKIVHLHITNPFVMLFLCVIAKIAFTKVILTLHGNLGRYNWLKNSLVNIVVSIVDIPILINKKSYKDGVKLNKNSKYIPAFIPPILSTKLDDNIIELLKYLESTKKTICSTNAYNISYDNKGRDIYGIDFLIHEFVSLSTYVLIISDPSGNYKKRYPEKLPNIYFIEYPHNYFELLKHISVFIRYTTTDGDSLSVKEALFLNRKVVCTDVVDRPSGVALCKLYDPNSFIEALTMPQRNIESSTNGILKNSAIDILELYKSLDNETNHSRSQNRRNYFRRSTSSSS